MMMHRIVILALLCTIHLNTIAQSFDAKLTELSDDIARKIGVKGKSKIAVWDFTDTDGNVTNLGKYLSEEISVNLTNSPQSLSMMDRNHLSTILREHKLNAEGFIDENTAKELGKINAVDAVVTGTITVLGDKIKLTIKVLDTETALIIAASKGELPISKEISTFIGVPDLSSSGTSDVNRGFNRPLNSNEQYNNPETVDKDCKEKETGDYCFCNTTNESFIVSLNADGVALQLSAGQTQCLYNLPSRSYRFHVMGSRDYGLGSARIVRVPSKFVYVHDNGQFLVETCKSKTYVIK